MLYSLIFSRSPCRAPEDGYYMFTLTTREEGGDLCSGSMMRTPALDPNNPVVLCRAEPGYHEYHMATCTVPYILKLAESFSIDRSKGTRRTLVPSQSNFFPFRTVLGNIFAK